MVYPEEEKSSATQRGCVARILSHALLGFNSVSSKLRRPVANKRDDHCVCRESQARVSVFRLKYTCNRIMARAYR